MFKTRLLMTVAGVSVFLALCLTVARLGTPLMERYHLQFEALASGVIGQPVKIGSIETAFKGLQPQFDLHSVTIYGREQTVLQIDALKIGIDLWHSLLNRRWTLGSITLNGATAVVNQTPSGKLILYGEGKPGEKTQLSLPGMLGLLQTYRHIKLENFKVHVKTSQGTAQTFFLEAAHFTKVGSQYRLKAVLKTDPSLPGKLQLQVSTRGRWFDPDQFRVKFFVSGQSFPIKLIDELYPQLPGTLLSGLANFKVWGKWMHGDLSYLRGQAELSQFAIKAHPLKVFKDDKFSTQFYFSKAPDKSHHLLLTSSVGKLAVRWNDVSTTWRPDVVTGSNLNLNFIQQAVTHLYPYEQVPAWYRLFEQNRLHGYVEKLTYKKADAPTNAFSSTLDLTLQQVEVKPLTLDVHFEPLDGKFQWRDNHGFGELYPTKQKGLTKFKKPARFTVDTFKSEFDIRLVDNGWVFNIPTLMGSMDGAQWQSNTALFVPHVASVSPELNSTIHLSDVPVAAAKAWLHATPISPALNQWLQQAVETGEIKQADVVVRGPLNQFPFKSNEGVLQLSAELNNIDLDYHPDWPKLTHANFALAYEGDEVHINASSGQILQTGIDTLEARITKVLSKDATLNLSARTHSDLTHMQTFIDQSPLAKTIGYYFEGMQLIGPMQLNLNLAIPLVYPTTQPVKVKGELSLNNAHIKLSDWGMNLRQLNGEVQFTETDLASMPLTGTLEGAPITLSLGSKTQAGETITAIGLSGEIDTNLLRKQGVSIPSFISGKTTYTGELTVPKQPEKGASISLTTDMQGIGVRLPLPFYKSAGSSKRADLVFKFARNAPFYLEGAYDDILSFSLKGTKDAQGLAIRAGEISIGQTPATLGQQDQVIVKGYLPDVNLQHWVRAIKDKGVPRPLNELKLPRFLDRMILQFKALEIGQQRFETVVLNAKSEGDTWKVKLRSKNLEGALWLPYDFSAYPVRAHFNKLFLDKSEGDVRVTESDTTWQPLNIPELTITSDAFQYGDWQFGQASLVLKLIENGIMIEKFETQSPFLNINLTGQWLVHRYSQSARLTGYASSSDVANALRQLGMHKPSLEAEYAHANLEFNWPVGLPEARLETMSGKAKVKIKSGRVLNVGADTDKKIGIGRVLTLFDLDTLPKRLQLDFSDLTNTGFNFNKIQGDFLFDKGNVTTTGTALEGTVANLNLQGRIGLTAQDYALLLDVQPHFMSSLPLVAAIAAGPVVGPVAGAVTYMANKTVGPKLEAMSAYTYQVTGPWAAPQIKRLD